MAKTFVDRCRRSYLA